MRNKRYQADCTMRTTLEVVSHKYAAGHSTSDFFYYLESKKGGGGFFLPLQRQSVLFAVLKQKGLSEGFLEFQSMLHAICNERLGEVFC